MATLISTSIFTPLTFLNLLLLSSQTLPVASLNITQILAPFPDLSAFAALLTSTAVAGDLSNLSAVTVLAVPNSYLRSDRPPASGTNLADVLRYHILLQYLSLSDLRRAPPTGKLMTTLLQTTGRAADKFAAVNITFDAASAAVTFHSPSSNASLISPIETLPYNLSILSIDSLLVPYNMNLMASETRPPVGLNITKSLIDGHSFNVAASMLSASGLVSEFEADEAGAGITLFAPTDEAFSDLPPSVRFQSLPAEKKAAVLRFHVLHSYYPLGSLESIVNPVYPTLATEQNGAGSFTVNISRVNGSVAIDTGIVQAAVTQTVCDQNPVAIFGVSKVLLPKEFFGKNPIGMNENEPSHAGGAINPAPPPEIALPPQYPAVYGPPSHITSPPGLELRAAAAAVARGELLALRVGVFRWWCCVILFCHLILLL
ncbi:fasciclin-like arabinogalactan protein 4 [Andrographis paniculata]|uniref:fasciclin-like arabinogalactan protein 4 n=1 Tax=Andrographis paniculata TaxID=175694 RepID=UPI0021E78CF6|nr:fasciclin-like arabinogalactan protein 4 [Andrographis paniculata]